MWAPDVRRVVGATTRGCSTSRLPRIVARVGRRRVLRRSTTLARVRRSASRAGSPTTSAPSTFVSFALRVRGCRNRSAPRTSRVYAIADWSDRSTLRSPAQGAQAAAAWAAADRRIVDLAPVVPQTNRTRGLLTSKRVGNFQHHLRGSPCSTSYGFDKSRFRLDESGVAQHDADTHTHRLQGDPPAHRPRPTIPRPAASASPGPRDAQRHRARALARRGARARRREGRRRRRNRLPRAPRRRFLDDKVSTPRSTRAA